MGYPNTGNNDLSNFKAPQMVDAIEGESHYGLDVSNPDYIIRQHNNITIEVVGGIHDVSLTSLKVSLKIYKTGASNPLQIYRSSLVDLFNDNQVDYTLLKVSERLKIERNAFKHIFYDFIERLDNYRRNKSKLYTPAVIEVPELKQSALSILKGSHIFHALEEHMKTAGISATDIAVQLYVVSLSRITAQPLHAVINTNRLLGHQLLKEVASLLPCETTQEFTTISKHALSYPPSEDFWDSKNLVLHQLDSIKDKEHVLHEYVSKGISKRLITQTDERTGNY